MSKKNYYAMVTYRPFTLKPGFKDAYNSSIIKYSPAELMVALYSVSCLDTVKQDGGWCLAYAFSSAISLDRQHSGLLCLMCFLSLRKPGVTSICEVIIEWCFVECWRLYDCIVSSGWQTHERILDLFDQGWTDFHRRCHIRECCIPGSRNAWSI